MSTMFFKYKRHREANDLVQSISTMFLTPTNDIKATDVSATAIRKKSKVESLSNTELLAFTVSRISGVPNLTIVEYKKSFASDAKFIQSFQNNYLGTIKKKIKKSELVELAKLQAEYEYSQSLESWLHPNFPLLRESFDKAGLNEKDCAYLKTLYKSSVKPVDDWIKERNYELKKQIVPLTTFLIRGY